MHRGKVDPGVSELPRGNELSRDHVNRPLKSIFVSVRILKIEDLVVLEDLPNILLISQKSSYSMTETQNQC